MSSFLTCAAIWAGLTALQVLTAWAWSKREVEQ